MTSKPATLDRDHVQTTISPVDNPIHRPVTPQLSQKHRV